MLPWHSYGKSNMENSPVIKTDRNILSSHITSISLNFTGISVAIRHGTKLARKTMEVTGITAIIYLVRRLHSPTVTRRAGMVTSIRDTAAPVDAVTASAAGTEIRISG